MAKKYTFEPDYAHAIPPGDTLKETLDAKGLSQSDLSTRTGLAEKTISQIVRGVAPITLDTAEKLELALGIPARFWNARELTYREGLARAEAVERLSADIAWLKEIPVKELMKRRYITPSDSKPELVRQVLRFFGVSNVEAWRATWATPYVLFRGKKVQERHPGKVAAWLRMCELRAENVDCQPYGKQKFSDALREIRRYVDKDADEWYPAMIRLCADAGVAVVFVKQIPGGSISGATKWLSKDKALIMLSLKHKTDDHVWFTFFHEAFHVLKHGRKLVFIDDDQTADDELEEEANRLARNILIPYERARELHALRGRIDIKAFARSVGVSSGIVVGRLQKDKLLSHKLHYNLKVKLKWPEEDNPER